MPQYAVLIFEHMTPEWPDDITEEGLQERFALPERIAERGGRIVAGMGLQHPQTATTIRDSGSLVTDGPFMETKEALGGAFVLDARDLDHALALAKLAAGVHGTVEVRPLLGFEIVEAG